MSDAIRKYGFINAKLRARISKILSDEALEQMLRAPDLGTALAFLRDTAYASLDTVYSSTGDLKMAELELYSREIEMYVELRRYLSDDTMAFVRALTLRFETENLKNAVRLWFDRTIRGRAIDAYVGYLYRKPIVHAIALDAVINAASADEISAILKGTPYSRVMDAHKASILQNQNLFTFENALDILFYQNLLDESDKLPVRDRGVARRLLGIEIDLVNINWITRFRTMQKLPVDEALRYVIPSGHNLDSDQLRAAYEERQATDIVRGIVEKKYTALRPLLGSETTDVQSRLVLIERILSEIMLQEIRHSLSGYPFTIGVILAYFILKGAEMRRVMTILNAKSYSIEYERIKSRL